MSALVSIYMSTHMSIHMSMHMPMHMFMHIFIPMISIQGLELAMAEADATRKLLDEERTEVELCTHVHMHVYAHVCTCLHMSIRMFMQAERLRQHVASLRSEMSDATAQLQATALSLNASTERYPFSLLPNAGEGGWCWHRMGWDGMGLGRSGVTAP